MKNDHNYGTGYLIVLVLYILLAIIMGGSLITRF